MTDSTYEKLQMLTATFSDDSLQSDDLRLIRATEAAHNIKEET